MGALLDAHALTLKDLGYAAEAAWDDSVRKSAMALMLERLDQILKEPPPTTGLVEVVSGGRSYSEYKQLFLTWFEGTVFGFFFGSLLAVAVVGTILNARRVGTGRPISDLLAAPGGYVALGIVILMVGLLFALVNIVPDLLSKRIQKQIDDYRRGQEGEDRVVEVILQALDGNWKVFRNVSVPGMKRSDIDVVLVGPPGVWALEVKNLRGEYRNSGDSWEFRHGKTWKKSRAQPSQEARAHAAALGGFLKADGLHVFANPAVVWAKPESAIIVDNPSVAVWTLERLPDELGNIWYSKQVPEAARAKIVDKLTTQCAEQREKDAKRVGTKAL
jgi:hypothetical protein